MRRSLRKLGLTTLQERRHQADILQVYKIVIGKDSVDRPHRCQMASEAPLRTRQAGALMNIVRP
jgi:hypothetical protein